jgi:hypothetical protein
MHGAKIKLEISLGITAVNICETLDFYWASGKMMARGRNIPHGLAYVWKMVIKMFD